MCIGFAIGCLANTGTKNGKLETGWRKKKRSISWCCRLMPKWVCMICEENVIIMSYIKRCLIRNKYRQRKKTAVKNLVARCSQYMIPGWWHVEYESGKHVLKKGVLPKKCTCRDLFRILFFGIYWVKNYNPKAQCNKALASPFENYKLFDEVNGKVYTMYSEHYWKKVERFCNKMLPYFNTEIILVDKERHLVIERYLQNMQEVDAKKCFYYFCEAYKEYLQHIEIGASTISPAYIKEIFDAAKLPEDVRDYLDHINRHIKNFNVHYPVIICHNDVHVDNMLTNNNEEFSLIDYELCSENICFFDYMGLIFNSAVFMNKPLLFDAYWRGAFDEQLAELFKICGIYYDGCDREHYLFVFLLFRTYMIYVNSPNKLQEYTNRMWKFFRKNELL